MQLLSQLWQSTVGRIANILFLHDGKSLANRRIECAVTLFPKAPPVHRDCTTWCNFPTKCGSLTCRFSYLGERTRYTGNFAISPLPIVKQRFCKQSADFHLSRSATRLFRQLAMALARWDRKSRMNKLYNDACTLFWLPQRVEKSKVDRTSDVQAFLENTNWKWNRSAGRWLRLITRTTQKILGLPLPPWKINI